MKTRNVFIGLVLAFLLGCAGHQEEPNAQVNEKPKDPVPALGNIEYYTHKLASELFAQTRPSAQSRYAIVGFVPIPEHVYHQAAHHPLHLLGHQLKEGFMTEAAKRGYLAQDFLLADDINVTTYSDSMITRNVARLDDTHPVDFIITGTVLNQEKGAVVNARMIHAQTKEIVAGATTFFPAELFWQTEQVSLRNGRLIRTQNTVFDSTKGTK